MDKSKIIEINALLRKAASDLMVSTYNDWENSSTRCTWDERWNGSTSQDLYFAYINAANELEAQLI